MASTSKNAVTGDSAPRNQVTPTISDNPVAAADPRQPADPDAQNETFAPMLTELDGRIDKIERHPEKLIAR
jgi:hypothetical protein